MDTPDLTETFIALGHSPETAAYYAEGDQAEEMVVRAAFLHMLWELVVDEQAHRDGEPTWLEEWLRGPRRSGEPPKGVAAALQRMLDKGVDPEDLTDVVRAQQFEIIYNLCQLLDGQWLDELRQRLPALPPFSWRLYQVSEDDQYVAHPVRPLEDLHSELGDLDPAGRGGDPRSR